MDENLEWLTQKTEDPKSNKGNLTFPSHTVIKKWQPPISTSTPSFQVYPPFLAKNFLAPLVTQFSEGPTPPFNKGGGGFPTM